MAKRRRSRAKQTRTPTRRAAASTARATAPVRRTLVKLRRRYTSELPHFTPQFSRLRKDQGASPSRFIPRKRFALVDRPRQIPKHSHGPQQTRFCNHKRDRLNPTPTTGKGLARIQWMAIKC